MYGDLALDTDEVFTEDSPYRPRTPYNASKAGADHAVRAYFETFGLPVTITNCSNNYGPFQFPEKVVPLFTTNALDDEPLPMYASTQNKREWLHVLDHCEAIDLVLREGRPGETYNVGSGVEATIEEIADRVLELTGKPDRAQDDRPGPPRTRPALPPRRHQDRAGAGLGAVARLRGRAARDRRLVRSEPRVVGAAQRARAGRRICLEIDLFAQGVRAIGREHKELTLRSYPGALVRALVAAIVLVLTVTVASASGQQTPPSSYGEAVFLVSGRGWGTASG